MNSEPKHCAPILFLVPGHPLTDGSGRPADMCTYDNPIGRFSAPTMRQMHARFLVPTGSACVGDVNWRRCS